MEIALIGCGRIGALLEKDPLRYKPCTHYGGAASAGIPVTLACDIDRKRLEGFGREARIGRGRLFSDHRRLFERFRPDLAVIATWTESHEEIAGDAMDAGVKLIVLEKPAASTLEGSARMLAKAAATGARVMVNHERRYDNRYRRAKKILSSGAIGRVRSAHARVITGPFRGKSLSARGGGPLLHDGTHLVDIARYLLGEAAWVQGEWTRDSRSRGFEDRAAAWIRFQSGADLFLEAGGSARYFHFEVEIWGTEGRLALGNGIESLSASAPSRFYTGFRDLEEVPFSCKKNNCFTGLYEEARRIIEGKSRRIVSSLADGHRALELIDAVYLSSFNGGGRITLPLDPSAVDIKKIFDLME